jgi:thiamine kinase-like enzyme
VQFSDTEIRLLGVATPQLLKMLHEKEVQLLNRIYGDFKAGNLDQLAALTEFTVLRDLQNEITKTMRRWEAQEAKLHDTATTYSTEPRD